MHRFGTLFDRLKGQLNELQERALLCMFREGPEGFKGGLSAGQYTTITGTSPATATRDLTDLMEKGLESTTRSLNDLIRGLRAGFDAHSDNSRDAVPVTASVTGLSL
jgi:Fic family protein